MWRKCCKLKWGRRVKKRTSGERYTSRCSSVFSVPLPHHYPHIHLGSTIAPRACTILNSLLLLVLLFLVLLLLLPRFIFECRSRRFCRAILRLLPVATRQGF